MCFKVGRNDGINKKQFMKLLFLMMFLLVAQTALCEQREEYYNFYKEFIREVDDQSFDPLLETWADYAVFRQNADSLSNGKELAAEFLIDKEITRLRTLAWYLNQKATPEILQLIGESFINTPKVFTHSDSLLQFAREISTRLAFMRDSSLKVKPNTFMWYDIYAIGIVEEKFDDVVYKTKVYRSEFVYTQTRLRILEFFGDSRNDEYLNVEILKSTNGKQTTYVPEVGDTVFIRVNWKVPEEDELLPSTLSSKSYNLINKDTVFRNGSQDIIFSALLINNSAISLKDLEKKWKKELNLDLRGRK